MKTLAVIKNELFKDYLRFVSTSDLPSVLDNPDIPVPFTCLDSVENKNSDALADQLKSYFNQSKVKNKDFYTLDSDTEAQLHFMLNLIKLSSGQEPTSTSVAPVTAPVVVKEPTPVVEVKKEVVQPVVVPVEVVKDVFIETPVQEVVKPIEVTPVVVTAPVEVVEDVFTTEEDDPFGFKNPTEETEVVAPVVQEVAPVVVTPEPEVVKDVEVAAPAVELIASLGIPKGAVINFIKDESITATLVDDKTVSYDGQSMTLVEAAKAAFKKSGTVGMAVGLSNWNFEGETLKAWKEKQLN